MKKLLSIIFAVAFVAMTWMVANAHESDVGKSPPRMEQSDVTKIVKEIPAVSNLVIADQSVSVIDKDDEYILPAPINDVRKSEKTATKKYRSKGYKHYLVYLPDKKSKMQLKRWKDTHRR